MESYEIDMEIPTESRKRLQEQRDEIERWEKGKKLREQYPALRKRLEALRESRPTEQLSFKDQRAYEHFEFLKKQQDEQMIQLEKNFEKMKEQFETSKQNLLRKQLYVEEKLQKAKDRVETTTKIKTKEEILLEKNLVELIQKFIEIQPGWDVEHSFPGYKNLSLTLPTTSAVKEETVETKPDKKKDEPTAPLPPPPTPVGGVGSLSDETVDKMSEAELFALVRPNVKNPYSNVISNTKAKRKAKQCDA